ncbi:MULTISPECIES: hypothetical protein [Chitinophagaceae]|uniref:Uncharacterized protein n=1 Tax=Pseudobacter ginsenosidimutans TaxID=661488 RepID=A0A4Q7MYY2_9BACT|nr:MULTISPECIES: hypothetical protein [Chitinophagaceae]QEC40887.1 hypothetical protein FSB84_03945 [Pseudobacter ginsenosidimutans]RZS72380.1 hypothetical protein EV199_4299 [Pseudobacter ginsenosidimutans]
MNKPTTMAFLTILVSLYFIISGLLKMSKHASGSFLHSWGILLLLAGVAGTIWKLAEITKK